jgi:hypothetical protein
MGHHVGLQHVGHAVVQLEPRAHSVLRGFQQSRRAQLRAPLAALISADVLDKEFRIIAISDHGAFEQGSAEQLRFFGICSAYVAKDVPPGQAFMANPVMSSGHLMLVTNFFSSI